MKIFEIYIKLSNEHARYIVLSESKNEAMSYMQFVEQVNTEITEIKQEPLLVAKQTIKVNTKEIMKSLDAGKDIKLEVSRDVYPIFRNKFIEEYGKSCEVDMFSRMLVFENGAELRFIFI